MVSKSGNRRVLARLAYLGMVALVGSALGLSLSGMGAQASVPSSRNLGRHNLIVGSSPTRTSVVLPARVTIPNPTLRQSAFRIESSARFAGFALVHRETRRTWIGGQIRNGDTPLQLFAPVDPLDESGGIAEAYKLPAGDYLLYLLSNNTSRVKVKLDLPELNGSSRIVAGAEAEAQIKFPRVQKVDSVSDVHWVSAEGTIRSRAGAQLLATWFTTSRHVLTNYEACFYKGSVPEPDRSLPACAAINAADAHENNTSLRVSTYPSISVERGRLVVPAGRVYVDGDGWAPGRFSGALAVRSPAVEGQVRAVGVWLSF